MAVSICEIAKAADVSTATISRVINNHSNVRDKTRERVLRVIKELNYAPNVMARGLSNSKAFNVALLIDVEDSNYFNPFFYEVMHGIEAIVHKRGLCLIIASSTPSEKLETLERLIREKRMQGVFIPSSLADKQLISKLNELNFPFVVIGEVNNPASSVSWVDINNRQGGDYAVSHLVDRGYQRVAFISGSTKIVFNRNRVNGYRDAVERLGLTSNLNLICECDGSKNESYSVMKELLSNEPRPDAVICGNNIISIGVMKAVHEIGMNIPNDFGLVSFDKYPLAELVEPSLTTVDIDVFLLGELAANSLVTLMETPKTSHIQSLISTNIESRESTARNIPE